jgi:aldehyde:ferredoxin oxidoreductase
MITSGWAGKRAVVNLRSQEVTVEEIPYDHLKTRVGGRGLNVSAMRERTEVGLDPFNPDSPFCLAVGPLAGSFSPCASALHLACRSPLTDPPTLGLTSVTGSAGPRLKLAGFDQLIVTGRSETPVVLLVEKGGVSFHDASDLWGSDAVAAQVTVQEQHGGRRTSVLSIGLAGENEVRFASVLADSAWPADGFGLGAVWGAKKLKAVAIRGTDTLRPVHGPLLREKGRDIRSAFAASPGIEALSRRGNFFLLDGLRSASLVSERNFTVAPDTSLRGWMTLSAYDRGFSGGPVGCFACPVHCGRYTAGEELSSRGIHFGGVHAEGVLALSARIGIRRWFDTLRVYHACIRLGLDPVAFGALTAWLTDGYSRGLLDTRLAGRSMAWNDAEFALYLAEIVARREGPGRFLGEGTLREARRAGGGADRILAHTAGVDSPGVDLRLSKGAALAAAVAPHEGDGWNSLRPPVLREHLALHPRLRELAGPSGESADFAVHWEGKARLLARTRALRCLAEMAGMCTLPLAGVFALEASDVAELLYAVTGETFSAGELVVAALDVMREETEVLLRDGMGLDLLKPPDRFYAEPVAEGPWAGAVLREGEFLAARSEYIMEMNRLEETSRAAVGSG